MFKEFLAMIFPEYCLTCQQGLASGEDLLCTDCRHDLSETNFHQSPQDNLLFEKFKGRVNLEYALAFLKFVKGGKTQKLLYHLKYNNNPKVGELLGLWYGFLLKKEGLSENIDLIVPIPLHSSKLKKRGYNQSEEFAKGLSESMQVPYQNAVERIKFTVSQTKKSNVERWQNIEKVYAVKDNTLIKDKHILVVDDLITTGATLEFCLNELKNSGAKKLSIATIAVPYK